MSPEQTSLSLLDRLVDRPDPTSWERLVAIYTPLLKAWLRRYQLQPADADDLVQEVLAAVSQDLGAFRHSGRPGSFRAWLRTILVHRLKYFWRAGQRRPMAQGTTDFQDQLAQLEDPGSTLSHLWDREHDEHVLRHLLDANKSKFTPQTWRAFQRLVCEGAKAAEVAAELGMSVNAVLIAKSRVLSCLKRESRGLLD